MQKSKEPQISACFVISGNGFNTDECTRAIGREPTEIGHPKEGERPEINDTEWIIDTGKLKLYSVDEVVSSLMEDVWPHRERIETFLKQTALKGSFCCFVTIFEERPLYELSEETMRKMAALGCDFSMDIYDYSEMLALLDFGLEIQKADAALAALHNKAIGYDAGALPVIIVNVT